ncbi:hypothetical protein B2G71_17205 [Novosphingobium sp. PC22D]|uniref:EthD domain-containing protein n=1 Tax=Novosphingobium sp. PC22D TaxID=1962403 RepID=UPI000BF204C5|nr:EthD domain-containing protein [Novosphingobium sp. PC22D]PEQ11303.1 hypothetical protein B2G71_17205 [Novosphingobium sp. PC22D]
MSLTSPKLVYLTRRNPAFSREDWTARWRQHGALGMAQPRWRNVARYVHCDLIAPSRDQRGWLGDHDGVGMIWHRSIAHRHAHFADRSSQAVMERDEEDTFAEPIALHCASLAEVTIMAADPAARWHAFCFAWDDTPLPTPPGIAGHVRSRPLPRPGGQLWGLDCAKVEEFWFRDPDGALAACEALAKPSRICVVGHDCELYRREPS